METLNEHKTLAQLSNSPFHANLLDSSLKPNLEADLSALGELANSEKVLLINPPIYDTRLPWSHWVQPTSLLKLGTYLKRQGIQTRLLDIIHLGYTKRIKRRRLNILNVDGLSVSKWRYGLPEPNFRRHLEGLRKEGWTPDSVTIRCFTTFWWEGAREAVEMVKEVFPDTTVFLTGAYVALAEGHAQTHSGASHFIAYLPQEVVNCPSDYALYEERVPLFGYVSADVGGQTPEKLVNQITEMAKNGIKKIAFTEHDILQRYPELFRGTLELLSGSKVRPHLYALGNVGTRDFLEHPDLAKLMKRANYKQISFADDRHSTESPEELISAYAEAAELCFGAGFSDRTGAINAGISIGKPGEDLEDRARLAAHFAHHTGSIIFWPYQPLPSEGLELSLELQNGKLFPYRRENGYSYRDYLNVLGIGTLFNARYRGKSFDFLGRGLMSQIFLNSVNNQGWDPDPSVKGSTSLPARGRT